MLNFFLIFTRRMPKRPKLTMRDVARLAGVSTSTVSAVVNQNVPVSPERKKRILDAMAALDYQPDAIARGLKTGKSNVIGIVVPDITNVFYPEVVRAVEVAAREAGYAVLLCDSTEDSQNEENHLKMLLSRRVDGVLLACCSNSMSYVTALRRTVPIVFFDRLPPGANEYTVSTDNIAATYAAMRHLIELGHERIAMLAGNTWLSPHHDRLEGFRKAMQEARLPIRDEYLISGNVQIEDGLNAMRRLLSLGSPPSAVLASNNKLLLGCLQGLDEAHVRIPDEMSIVGFDDYVWNRYFNPSVTAIAQPTYEIGKCAFELLSKLIALKDGDELPETCVRIAAELRVRNSTAPPSAISFSKA
jgi:LacI family transcriptional regulator